VEIHWDSRGGPERLIYTFYPTLVLLRCRTQVGEAGKSALSRVADFIELCEEQQDPFWVPLRSYLRNLLGHHRRQQKVADASLNNYWQLFEHDWPIKGVFEEWHPNRFTMTLMCGSNYLLLRRQVAPKDPVALLHIRYYADEMVGNGWTDRREEQQRKTWATALWAQEAHLGPKARTHFQRVTARLKSALPESSPSRVLPFPRTGRRLSFSATCEVVAFPKAAPIRVFQRPVR
jgi:hypothetical protein